MALFSLTVNASDVPSSQSNFPAYVDLSRAPAGFWSVVTNGGGDIRCYADSGKTTEYAREVVSCDTGTETGEMHVKITSLTSTTTIYIDVDGIRSEPAFTDTYGRNAVWTGYNAVYHINAAGGVDATGNGRTLTETSMSYTTGQMGNAGDIGTNAQIRRLSRSDNLGIGHEGAFTTTFIWKQTTDDQSGTPIPFRFVTNTSTNYKGFQVQYESTGPRVRIFAENSILVTGALGTSIRKFKVTRASGASGAINYYLNNTFQGSTTQGINAFNSTGEISVGANVAGNGANGYIDEVRVAPSVLSTSWETTEYNNQSDEAGFWGTWSDVGGGGGYRFVPQIRPFVGL